MKLTEISIKRPVFATVIILALVVVGLVSYMSLAVDQYPSVELPVVAVIVQYPGAAPEQVESKVTQKIEEAVSEVAGVEHVTSTVSEGVSTTVIQFTMETNADAAAQNVRDKLGGVQAILPDDAKAPIISRFDPTDIPIMSIAITGDVTRRELTVLAEDIITKRLKAVNGVASVDVKGGLDREIQIQLDSNQMSAYSLTISEVLNSLRNENIDSPGGKISDGQRKTDLRAVGSIKDTSQFLDIAVGQRGGVPLYVKNIATIEDTTEELATVTKLNDMPALGLDVMKQSGSNTVQVVDNVKKQLESIKKELPPGIDLVVVRDNSKTIKESVQDVEFNLVVGGILAVAIVFLFLGNWRSTIISGIAIPVSVIASFMVMKALNFTLNTMSLLALSLAVGLLIDDAIVVIENIVRHLEMGKDKVTAALDGTAEIGLAVMATTFTLVAVFVPVGMMSGTVGQFFKEFGITVAASVLVSLFVAFTLTPMLSAKYLDYAEIKGNSKLARAWFTWNAKFDELTAKYGQFLRLTLRQRRKVILVAAALFLGSLMLLPLLGSTFIPDADNEEITVSAVVDPGMSVNAVGDMADSMVQIIRGLPEVRLTYSVANSKDITILAELTPKGQRDRSDEAIIKELRQKFSVMTGAEISVSKKAAMTNGKPVSLVVQGTSLETLAEIAEQVEQVVASIPGAVEVSSSYEAGNPDAQLVVKHDRAADLGISTASIADTLQTMFNGKVVTQYKEGEDSYDVRVILDPDKRRSLADVKDVYLSGSAQDKSGQVVMVPLDQVTDTVYATSPAQIKRYDNQQQITISANLSGITLGEFNTAFQKKVADVAMPEGYQFVTTGQTKSMNDAFSSMVVALTMAVLFIFFVLAAQFESYLDPFAIMLALPLAIIGAIIGLLVMGSELSVMSLIGIIMLMGLVTKNAILLVDFAKQRLAQGVERNQALVEAATKRMRPIIMTTAAMIVGMIPLALGIGPGAEARAPMAHAIIGGLVTSTILTLVVVPVVYTLFDDIKNGKFTVRRVFKRV
ncbi:Multidrug resistance protein MdtB [Sporomusa ovata DSM 2662]|uniref:RND multidrug efflux transporter Acriflavin resistance protein n=1 Tax=Sporomusa ovata TaxID=2378 RepID=A0A0U1L0B8_9FIRM|nr:efflux RND transporter permease subunit [Sporomusa ovata]EQB27259.1 nodulation protein NolG [Sporomusa ovata DSM 2662]CQR73102.1 RND multidrug efflux transporter; Acriflavin resistance protein [Sporomusa ovata]